MSLSQIEIKIYQNYQKSKGQNHRFNSWNHCFKAFSHIEDTNLLSLHLGFYLASWGMYRGSGELLQKDYLIHKGAVEILTKHKALRATINKEINPRQIQGILEISKEIGNYYKYNGISPTDTLISKILLGTLGCLPAYDRFYKFGAKENNVIAYTINRSSLTSLFAFIDDNKKELMQIQSKIYKEDNVYYPIMKLVDMYFWQIGYEERYVSRT